MVMKLLARKSVLWLNSIGMRTPTLGSAADRAKVLRKLKSFTKRPEQVAHNLWVYTPIVFSLPQIGHGSGGEPADPDSDVAALAAQAGHGPLRPSPPSH